MATQEPRFIIRRRFGRWHVVDTHRVADDGIYYGRGAKARAQAACDRLNGILSPEGQAVANMMTALCARPHSA